MTSTGRGPPRVGLRRLLATRRDEESSPPVLRALVAPLSSRSGLLRQTTVEHRESQIGCSGLARLTRPPLIRWGQGGEGRGCAHSPIRSSTEGAPGGGWFQPAAVISPRVTPRVTSPGSRVPGGW